jgi:hypothetical protein
VQRAEDLGFNPEGPGGRRVSKPGRSPVATIRGAVSKISNLRTPLVRDLRRYAGSQSWWEVGYVAQAEAAPLFKATALFLRDLFLVDDPCRHPKNSPAFSFLTRLSDSTPGRHSTWHLAFRALFWRARSNTSRKVLSVLGLHRG